MKLSKADLQQLGEMGQPIACWLRDRAHPHARVEIDSGRVAITEEWAGVPIHPSTTSEAPESSAVDTGKLYATQVEIRELEAKVRRWREEHTAAVEMVERRDRTIVKLRGVIRELEEALHKRDEESCTQSPYANPVDILDLLADLCDRAASDMRSSPGRDPVLLQELGDTIRKEHRALTDEGQHDASQAGEECVITTDGSCVAEGPCMLPPERVSRVRVLLWNRINEGYAAKEHIYKATADHTAARRMTIRKAHHHVLANDQFVEASADGWVECWGEAPVGPSVYVEVKYPDRSMYRGLAKYVDWRLARLFRLDPTPQAPDPSLAS